MLVGLLTIGQEQELQGVYFADDQLFNPVLDSNSNWVITTIEIDNCTNIDYLWVKSLPLIEWTGPLRSE